MDRRAFLGAFAFFAGPLAAPAQQAGPRIGVLTSGGLERADAFRQGLRDLGYVEGQNILIEYRTADGNLDRLPRLATELARLKVDLIFVGGDARSPCCTASDHHHPDRRRVCHGRSRRRWAGCWPCPAGGNITGTTFLGPELVPKRLELLKDALPKVTRVAALLHPGAFGERTTRDMVKDTRRLQPVLWGCDFNSWRREVPTTSTVHSPRWSRSAQMP